MKIIPLLEKIELDLIKLGGKLDFIKKARKGDTICVIYYDLDKEQVKLKWFAGSCTKLLSNGLNSKVSVRTSKRRISVEHEFFLHGKTCIDAGILRKAK